VRDYPPPVNSSEFLVQLINTKAMSSYNDHVLYFESEVGGPPNVFAFPTKESHYLTVAKA